VIPTEEPEGNTANWAALNGVPGGIDVGVQLAVEKVVKMVQIVVNLGYRSVGSAELGGMRVQYVDSSRAGTPGFIVGEPKAVPLELHDQFSATAGARVPIFRMVTAQMWALGEISHVQFIGSATPVERVIDVTEFRLGIQGEIGLSQPDPRRRVASAADRRGRRHHAVTNFKTPDRRGASTPDSSSIRRSRPVGTYFAQNGVTPPHDKVFATNNAAFDGWRNVKAGAQPVVAAGNNAILAFITWRFR
jgi:hypothetical protein